MSEFDVLAHGYGLVEHPLWEPGGSIVFSDVIGGGVHRWHPDGSVVTVVPNRRGVGGLASHVDGGIVCSGRDVIHVEDGATGGSEPRRLFDPPEDALGYNDLTVDALGRVIVGELRYRALAGDEPVPGRAVRVEGAGRVDVRFTNIVWPNGTGIGPDDRTLYMCDYHEGTVLTHDLDAPGDTAARVFARSPSGEADGLAVDVEGGVWVATGSGGSVVRFDSTGSLVQTVDVPARFVATVSFGGPDGEEMLIGTTDHTGDPALRGCLLRAPAPVAGLPVPAAAV